MMYQNENWRLAPSVMVRWEPLGRWGDEIGRMGSACGWSCAYGVWDVVNLAWNWGWFEKYIRSPLLINVPVTTWYLNLSLSPMAQMMPMLSVATSSLMHWHRMLVAVLRWHGEIRKWWWFPRGGCGDGRRWLGMPIDGGWWPEVVDGEVVQWWESYQWPSVSLNILSRPVPSNVA